MECVCDDPVFAGLFESRHGRQAESILAQLESLQYSDETDDPYNELSLGEKSFRENDFCLPRSIFGARLSHAQREA